MQEYTSPSERLKALTDQLEQGVSDIFQSGQYAAYLIDNYIRRMCGGYNGLFCTW